MLTPTLISAESVTPALTPAQKLNLQLLVRSAYPSMSAAWDAALDSGLTAEMANPSERTQALKAVLTQLDTLPAEDVESQGDSNSPTFFASQANWKGLALDTLNVFRIQVGLAHQSYGVVQKTIADGILDDDNWIRQPVPYIK